MEATAVGRVYTCEARATSLESSILENVAGDHLPGNSNNNVDYLKTSHLPFVPAGIAEFFDNLRAIDISSNEVFLISAEDLRPFPQLEFLALYLNNLVSIDGDLFSFTPHLKCIAFAYNQIQHIGNDLVTNLNYLQYLYLNGNVCVDQNAVTQAEVEELAPQLSVLCPPLLVTTTAAAATTTPEPIEQCSCNDEIDELRASVQQQNTEIAQLQQSNAQLLQTNTELVQMNGVVDERLSERLLGAAKNFVRAFCVQD